MDIPGILLNAAQSFKKGGREALSESVKQFIDVYHGKPVVMEDIDIVSCVRLFINIHSSDHPKTLDHIKDVECLLRWFASLTPVRQAFVRIKDEAWQAYHDVMMVTPLGYTAAGCEHMPVFNTAKDPAFIYAHIQAATKGLHYLDKFHYSDGRTLVH